jgi:hypothetical protein
MRTRKKNTSVSNEMSFVLKGNTPILAIKGSNVNETPKKLFKGSVIQGFLKTRVVDFNGEKTPFKFIQLKEESGYISPRIVDLYIPIEEGYETSDFTGNKETKLDIVNKIQNEEIKPHKKNIFIAYVLPVLTGILGWQIAKKMDLDMKNKLALTTISFLLGTIPNYNLKNKQK